MGCSVCPSRVPSPTPLHFRMHLQRLPHTVPLSQMLPPNSRSQSSFLGASTPMTHWIDSLLSPRKGTFVAPHFTILSTLMPLSVSAVPVVGSHPCPTRAAQRCTTAATRSPDSSSHEPSPWYPCQSSACATLFATCSCLFLARCVIHIHFRAVLAATCQCHSSGNTHRTFISYPQKECKYRPCGNPPCHRRRPTCRTWPFPEASACSPAYGPF